MKSPTGNFVILLLALTIVILGVLSSRQHSQLRELEQTLTSVTAERDNAVNQSAEAARLASTRVPTAHRPPSTPATAGSDLPPATVLPAVAGAVPMIDNPRMQQAMAAS